MIDRPGTAPKPRRARRPAPGPFARRMSALYHALSALCAAGVCGGVLVLCMRALRGSFRSLRFEPRPVSELALTPTHREPTVGVEPGPGARDVYDVHASYRYEVEGRIYRSTRVSFGPTRPAAALDLVRRHRAGGRVHAYVDPRRPEEVCLIRGPNPLTLIAWAFAAAGLCGSLLVAAAAAAGTDVSAWFDGE